MRIIATAATLAHVLSTGCDPGLASILHRYQPHMTEGLAVLYILDLGDRSKDLEANRGRPFEHWEFIALEAGWYEAVFVLDDYGHGHVVLIPASRVLHRNQRYSSQECVAEYRLPANQKML